jgi:uncharacterized protein YgbK (DUF1537 family)
MMPAAPKGKSPGLLILADDLTGAADAAAACRKAGLDAVALLDASGSLPAADVVAIDADTRQKTADAAAAAVARLVGRLPVGRSLLYKKIDSTLRGHFGAEIVALLGALKPKSGTPARAVLAPAFPRTGRTTVGGRQYLDGRPLEETEAWRREQKREAAFLPDRMAAEGLTSALVPLGRVREGEEALLAALRGLDPGAEIIVCDAETEEDLQAIARASLRLDGLALWAGSAGLAGHLATALAPVALSPGEEPPLLHGPILFAVGSPSAVSQRQADLLAASGIVAIDIGKDAVALPGFTHGAATRAEAALAEGREVLLRVKPETLPDPGSAAIAAMLGMLAASNIDRAGALFVTGGETARDILARLKVPGLRLLCELEPGVAFSLALGPRAFPIITKAGAFGTETTMLDCYRTLHALRAEPIVKKPQSRR